MDLFCRKKRRRVIMLEIVIWDVQHGSAAYINTPNGKVIIIDLGTGDYSGNDAKFSPLQYLERNGISTIDQLIITHPHTDHIDDIFNIESFSVASLLRPRHLTEDDIRNANRSQDKSKVDKYFEFEGIYNSSLTYEDSVLCDENNGGVSIKCFISDNCPHSNINNHSVVTILEYLGVKIIIPGDNEAASWDKLLELEDFIESIKDTSILVAPHHGRENGYTDKLFDYFTPDIVIISDGPVSSTSITSKYTYIADGWTVHSRSGKEPQERSCLTTRNDGAIGIKIYEDAGQTYQVIYKD